MIGYLASTLGENDMLLPAPFDRYTIRLYRDHSTGHVVAECSDLENCQVQGTTYGDALNNLLVLLQQAQAIERERGTDA